MKFVILFLLFWAAEAGAADTFSISYENGKVVKSYPEGTRPVVGLALSGGSARGLAHLGVIEVLEREGIPVDRIAGTSMGSLIGGLYAAGLDPEELAQILESTDWTEYFSNNPERRDIYVTQKETVSWPLFDIRFQKLQARLPSSLSSGQQINNILTQFTGCAGYQCDADFNRLPIPFWAVTTDLNTPGNMVVLKSGNLARAIQASTTFPLIFRPVNWEGMYLVDGGLTNNLPVNVAREMGSDFVIAVAIDESMHELKDLENPINIADQSTSIMMRQITNQQRALADYVITPDIEGFSSSDFSRANEIIEVGRQYALNALPELREKLKEAETECRDAVVSGVTVNPLEAGPEVRNALGIPAGTGEAVKYARIAEGLERIWNLGWYAAIHATLDDTGGLTIELVEAPRRVRLELFSGVTKIGVDSYFDRSDDDPGTSFADVAAAVDSVVREYREDGHSFACITEVVREEESGILRVIIESPVITRISVSEPIRSRRSLITREYRVRAGSEFKMDDLITTIDNLYGTNLFELVYADIERYNGGVGITFHVDEKNWSVFRLGIRYDETNQSEIRVTANQENIFGLGNELSFLGQAGKRKKLLQVENQNDRIYNSYYMFNLKTYQLSRLRPLYEDHKLANNYRVDRYGSVISLGQQLNKLGNTTFEFKTETIWVKYPRAMGIKNEKKELRSIIVRSVSDNYDRYPFPYDGYTTTIYIESAQKFLGGTNQYVKLYWGGTYVASYRRKHAFIGRLALGTADATTPKIESFTLGGNPTRLNCYDYESGQSLYYSDFMGLEAEERYGNYLAAGSVAYRLFIPRYFYLTFVYNAGNVWDNNDSITAETLLQGYGVTGSFETIFGEMSFGWGITSRGDDRAHLAAGWEF